MNYSSQVVDLYLSKSHLVDPKVDLEGQLAGAAGDCERGCRIGFAACVSDKKIASLSYQAWACPDTVAACEAICRQFEGMPLSEARVAAETLNAQDLMLSLQIPVEKAGKILTLQDALLACLGVKAK